MAVPNTREPVGSNGGRPGSIVPVRLRRPRVFAADAAELRIEVALGAAAVALGAWLRLTPGEWAALIVVIALVLILEGLNTALELVADLASPTVHPKAKAAKDVAAGMVLIAALASLAVAAARFGPRLLR